MYQQERDGAYLVIDEMRMENYADATITFKFSKRAKEYRKRIKQLIQEVVRLRWVYKDMVDWITERRQSELEQQGQGQVGEWAGAVGAVQPAEGEGIADENLFDE